MTNYEAGYADILEKLGMVVEAEGPMGTGTLKVPGAGGISPPKALGGGGIPSPAIPRMGQKAPTLAKMDTVKPFSGRKQMAPGIEGQSPGFSGRMKKPNQMFNQK